MCMKDISRELLQAFVARKATLLSAKSVRNLIALLGEMWVQARADGYTQLDSFVSLVLPDPAHFPQTRIEDNSSCANSLAISRLSGGGTVAKR